MYILTLNGSCFQVDITVKTAKYSAKKACMNQICFEFDGVRGKSPQKFPYSYVQKSKETLI